MTPRPITSSANQFLYRLPKQELAAFMAEAERVTLVFGEVLVEPGAAIEQVYFPLDSFISLIVGLDDGDTLEVAMAGREGMMGVSLLLGVREAPLRALVQGAGMALRMEADRFQSLLLSCPTLQARLMRYLHVVMNQLAHTVACTRFHQVEARLARWLLMTQYRAGANSLKLTHEFLAVMLGVRRAGITEAATALQTRGLISYHRGDIAVLDRAGLVEASCRCYLQDCSLYAKMLGDSR